jgi:hypothetical protein
VRLPDRDEPGPTSPFLEVGAADPAPLDRDLDLVRARARRLGNVFDAHVAAANDGFAARHGRLWEYVEQAQGDNRIDVTAFGGEPGAEARTLSLWWLTKSEWEGLIDVAGLEVEALYGWFDKTPFDDRSREFVWVTRKPG